MCAHACMNTTHTWGYTRVMNNIYKLRYCKDGMVVELIQSAHLQDVPWERFLRFIVETMCIEMNKPDIWTLRWERREAEVVPSLVLLRSHQHSL